jgi:hypothetical protein
MRWPRTQGFPNRTSGSIVIRSSSELWTAGIFLGPGSYCIGLMPTKKAVDGSNNPIASTGSAVVSADRAVREDGTQLPSTAWYDSHHLGDHEQFPQSGFLTRFGEPHPQIGRYPST